MSQPINNAPIYNDPYEAITKSKVHCRVWSHDMPISPYYQSRGIAPPTPMYEDLYTCLTIEQVVNMLADDIEIRMDDKRNIRKISDIVTQYLAYVASVDEQQVTKTATDENNMFNENCAKCLEIVDPKVAAMYKKGMLTKPGAKPSKFSITGILKTAFAG